MKSKWLIWAALGVAIAAGVYLGLRPTSSAKGVVNIDQAKAEELLADAGSVRVVDVRTAAEFEAGHLKGAENVPVDQIRSVAAGWDKSKPLLVYCSSGQRSATAVAQLESMGFTTIYHLNKGLIAWQGDLDNGQTVAEAPPVKTDGTPVMYEFYTDW